jgi:hypothetical protein
VTRVGWVTRVTRAATKEIGMLPRAGDVSQA